MASTARMSIVNVGYRSTNVWVVSEGTSRLLVDLGWPGTMDTLRALRLQKRGAPMVYAGHGPIRPICAVATQLPIAAPVGSDFT